MITRLDFGGQSEAFEVLEDAQVAAKRGAQVIVVAPGPGDRKRAAEPKARPGAAVRQAVRTVEGSVEALA